VVPQALPQLAGVTIYRWEYHFRASVVVGMVGVGGIGAELVKATKLYRWDQAVAILSIVFVLVFVVDGLGALLRRRFQ
jgi:phosphonate transport system permease protein